MLIIIISRSRSKLGHVNSKTRSQGQIIEKPCVHSRGHSFDQKFMRLCQNVILIKFRSSLKLGHVGSKTWLLCQIVEKSFGHQRGNNFDPKFMKLCQNVNS